MLNLTESFKLLKKLPLAKYKIISSESELWREFPYYLKASISEHKTEKQAVIKCKNEKEARSSFKLLKKKFPNCEIIIQEQVEGIELILGLKKDKVFGKLLMIGFGGIFAEAVKDVSFRAIPVDEKEIEKMIRELKFFPILINRKKYALDKFIKLAEKVSQLTISELDLNPVILNENMAIIVDARVDI